MPASMVVVPPPASAAAAPPPGAVGALDGVALVERRSMVKRSADREPEKGCSICGFEDGFVDAWSVGTCGHTFCEACIFRWLAKKASCPDCRGVIMVAELVPNFHAPKRARVMDMPTELVM